MSLKKNILASYASQIYVTLIGIVMVPFYVKYMGAEAYGLVGFFAMLQAWFQLLDMGLTPTMARETARFQGGGTDALSLRRLLRALEGIFIGVAVLGAAALMAGASSISRQWLNVKQLSLAEVEHAIMLIALIVAMRWVCGLYRGAISGFERQAWLGGFNAAIATARFVLVIPLLIYLGASPTHFFVFQLAVAVVELGCLVGKAYRLLPTPRVGEPITPWDWAPLRGVLKFSLSIAFTSSVWVMVTQTDKLVLSKLLPLADYAYFTLAVLVANGIMIIGGPISASVLPRMAKLHTQGKNDELIRLYRNATQLISIIAGSAAITLACCAEPLLFAWTGDLQIAAQAAPILRLYAIGNGFLAVAAFPYYLQYAKGNLRYHLIGNAAMVVVLIPGIIYATTHFGGVGAGYVWFTTNALYLLTWVAYVHHKLAPGLHRKWLFDDVLKIILPAIAISLLLMSFYLNTDSRLKSMIYVLLNGGGVMLCALVFSKTGRTIIFNKIRVRTSVQVQKILRVINNL